MTPQRQRECTLSRISFELLKSGNRLGMVRTRASISLYQHKTMTKIPSLLGPPGHDDSDDCFPPPMTLLSQPGWAYAHYVRWVRKELLSSHDLWWGRDLLPSYDSRMRKTCTFLLQPNEEDLYLSVTARWRWLVPFCHSQMKTTCTFLLQPYDDVLYPPDTVRWRRLVPSCYSQMMTSCTLL